MIPPKTICDLVPLSCHHVTFVGCYETTCDGAIYSWFIGQVSCPFCLLIFQILRVVIVNDIVDTTKGRGNMSLYVHAVLRRDHEDLKSALDNSNNPLNNILELGMT